MKYSRLKIYTHFWNKHTAKRLNWTRQKFKQQSTAKSWDPNIMKAQKKLSHNREYTKYSTWIHYFIFLKYSSLQENILCLKPCTDFIVIVNVNFTSFDINQNKVKHIDMIIILSFVTTVHNTQPHSVWLPKRCKQTLNIKCPKYCWKWLCKFPRLCAFS